MTAAEQTAAARAACDLIDRAGLDLLAASLLLAGVDLRPSAEGVAEAIAALADVVRELIPVTHAQ